MKTRRNQRGVPNRNGRRNVNGGVTNVATALDALDSTTALGLAANNKMNKVAKQKLGRMTEVTAFEQTISASNHAWSSEELLSDQQGDTATKRIIESMEIVVQDREEQSCLKVHSKGKAADGMYDKGCEEMEAYNNRDQHQQNKEIAKSKVAMSKTAFRGVDIPETGKGITQLSPGLPRTLSENKGTSAPQPEPGKNKIHVKFIGDLMDPRLWLSISPSNQRQSADSDTDTETETSSSMALAGQAAAPNWLASQHQQDTHPSSNSASQKAAAKKRGWSDVVKKSGNLKTTDEIPNKMQTRSTQFMPQNTNTVDNKSRPEQLTHQSAPTSTVMKSEPVPTPSSCEICDGYMPNVERLQQHLELIHKVKIHARKFHKRAPLRCQQCTRRFFTDKGLERHLVGSHGMVTGALRTAAAKGEDSGRCPMCGKMYRTKLLGHVEHDHQVTLTYVNMTYKCVACPTVCSTYKEFESHVNLAHRVLVKNCSIRKKDNGGAGGSNKNWRPQP